MSSFWEIIKKFFVESLQSFNSFLYSLYGLITGRRLPSSLEPSRTSGDENDYDPLHVHFTRSIAEKPSAVPPKPKLVRRATSGKGLLSMPLEDLLDDSDDSDDGNISIQSLASSSDFEISKTIEEYEKKVTEMGKKDGIIKPKSITFHDAEDTVLNSDTEDNAVGVESSNRKKCGEGKFDVEQKGGSNEDTLPSAVQLKMGNFIKQLPNVTPTDFEKTFNEFVAEFPRFKKIKSKQVYDIVQRDINQYKGLPVKDAADKLMEALCSCPKSH